MKNITLITAFTLAFAPLQGAVITETADFSYSGSSATSYLNQFNTSLGTLTSITLNWTLNTAVTSASLTNYTGTTATLTNIDFNQQVSGYFFDYVHYNPPLETLSANQHSIVSVSGGSAVLNPDDTLSYSGLTFSQLTQESYVNSGDDYFNYFKGAGSVPVYLSTSLGGKPAGSDGGGWYPIVIGNKTAHLTATYTYTPIGGGSGVAPVPEPSAMILGCGGLFFMVGLVFKKRRGSQSKLPSEV